MPCVKERSFQPALDVEELYKEALDLEEWYTSKEALQGLQNGTFKSLQKTATAYGLSKSSLAH